jgi:hypothetical protein
MRRWGLLGAWVLVVALTTTMTWQIVSAADQRVGDPVGAPLNVGPPSLDTTTTPPGTSSTTPVTTAPGSASTSGASSTSSSTPSPSTSQAPLPAETVVIPSAGGTVTVRVSQGRVTYLSAVPKTGYAVEVENPGPPEVRVEFESEESKVEIRAQWENGQLDVEINVED